MATQEERRRARVEQVFQRLDIDGSGGIDASELEQALVLMGVESSESVVSFSPSLALKRRTHKYPRRESLSGVLKPRYIPKIRPSICQSFFLFWFGLSHPGPPPQIASLFREADMNNDKVIDFEEFYRVMSTLILRQEAAFLEKEFSAAEQAKLEKTIVK
jgi:hypothetical protein